MQRNSDDQRSTTNQILRSNHISSTAGNTAASQLDQSPCSLLTDPAPTEQSLSEYSRAINSEVNVMVDSQVYVFVFVALGGDPKSFLEVIKEIIPGGWGISNEKFKYDTFLVDRVTTLLVAIMVCITIAFLYVTDRRLC